MNSSTTTLAKAKLDNTQ